MNPDETLSLRERLAKEIGVCLASDLVAHQNRGAVVMVGAALELLDVAEAIATDDAAKVAAWIEGKQIAPPEHAQVEAFTSAPELPFLAVIVRPYVLVQPLPRVEA